MEYKDPIEVSPGNYRLLLEDGDYRMVEMWLPAGTSDIEHSHPNEMVYFNRRNPTEPAKPHRYGFYARYRE